MMCSISEHSYCRYNELTIHGLGAAINRAINLALKLQESSPYELKVHTLINAHCVYVDITQNEVTTSTVELMDEFEPLDDVSTVLHYLYY